MKLTYLYLARHGAVISVNGKHYIGQIQAPLSERGVEQAWALRNWLEPVDFSHAYCSDLTRSERTARIVIGQRDLVLQPFPELREISLGDWEGVSFREIAQQHPEQYEARGRDLENWRPPGGESFADCRSRVLPMLRRILDNSYGNVILVGHAGVNRLILCDALGLPVQNLMNIRQDYGCVNMIEYGEGRQRLHLLNYSPYENRGLASVSSIEGALQRAR
ncbi:MAG: histidine phosphatase family protein [Acidobacteriota bacterium]|nr:histidine phosphatase family protein [Acidobacteriota bacterium]